MIRKVKNKVWQLLNSVNLGGCVQLMLKSQLLEDGWFKSFNSKKSVDKNGNPIPWNTYPFIKFIEPRLKKHFDVFEYGSGNSTIWFSARVNSIYSVENDKEWYNIVSKSLPDNSHLVYQELQYDGDYSKEVEKSGKYYHIVIIDGRDRVNCIKRSIPRLTEDGIIVFDNSDLSIYQEAIELLEKEGFRRIDFIGMSPVTAHNNYTTVFYKSHNCLNI